MHWLKMKILCYRSRMIAILPESTFPILSLVVFLPRPPGDQLHRLGYGISPFGIPHNQMNMV
jgi:hypothetical protein